MIVCDKFFIDGQWVAAGSSETIAVLNPATETPLGQVAAAAPADVQAAVQAASRAFDAWSGTPPARRADFLARICAGLRARADELVDLIAADVGMPRRMARLMQVGLPIDILDSYARLAADFPFAAQEGNASVLREPLGVAACITPWNYPLYQIAAKLGPALAAGCTVVLKPSEVAPLSTYVLAEIVAAAELPPGVVNLIMGTGPRAGEALVTAPAVRVVSFTGSTQVGRRINELAARDFKAVSLELGGKSASIVLDDADLAKAVRATVNSCFLNSGQTCLALSRLLVPARRYDEAAAIAAEVAAEFTTGDPFADGIKLGPLVSAAQRDRVRHLIRTAVVEGAEILAGGPEAPVGLERGYYVRPTVLGRVQPRHTVAQEEVFGPVLSMIACSDEDEAVAIANDSRYGLSGAVWSGSEERAERVARRLRTGQVQVNGGRFNLMAPFGGWQESGRGRELGAYGIDEFLGYKALLR